MVLQGAVDRLALVPRQAIARNRPDCREPFRLHADDLLEPGDRAAQVGLRQRQIRLGPGEPGFCLRHVRAGHFPDIETVPRLADLFRQHVHVVLAQFVDRLVAHDVHVGGDRIQQRVLLGISQGFPRGKNARFRLADRIGCPAAVIQRLVDGKGDTTRHQFGLEAVPQDLVVDAGVAGIRRERHTRPATGTRRGHALIHRTGIGALRVQVRVGHVGIGQGGIEILRRGALQRRETGSHQRSNRNGSENVAFHAQRPRVVLLCGTNRVIVSADPVMFRLLLHSPAES